MNSNTNSNMYMNTPSKSQYKGGIHACENTSRLVLVHFVVVVVVLLLNYESRVFFILLR